MRSECRMKKRMRELALLYWSIRFSSISFFMLS